MCNTADVLQGHLYGRQMRQANHRAAVQIFERVNRSLLPKNILDLHGLHVDEALTHLAQVLEDKATGRQQYTACQSVCLAAYLIMKSFYMLLLWHQS